MGAGDDCRARILVEAVQGIMDVDAACLTVQLRTDAVAAWA